MDKLQKERTDAEMLNGYRLFQFPPLSLRQCTGKVDRGTLLKQRLQQLDNNGLFQVITGDTKQLAPNSSHFQMPVFQAGPSIDYSTYSESMLENCLEEALRDLSQSDEPLNYLIATAHKERARKLFGLPKPQLEASDRLLSTKEHYAGVHSTYAYISGGRSFTCAHREDMDLESINILHHGYPKLWVVVRPRHTDKFEACIAQRLGSSISVCSQHVRHHNLILAPSLLHEWNIESSIFVQMPGWGVNTDTRTIHFVFNLGPNIAEAVNWCRRDWLPPVTYIACSQKCKGGQKVNITFEGMIIQKPRPLEIVDPDGEFDSDTKESRGQMGYVSPNVKRDVQPSVESEPESEAGSETPKEFEAEFDAESETSKEFEAESETSNEFEAKTTSSNKVKAKPKASNKFKPKSNSKATSVAEQPESDQTGIDKVMGNSLTISIRNHLPHDETIKQIQTLIQFAVDHEDDFEWLTGGMGSIRTHFQRFDPSRSPPKESWLNDILIFELLRRLSLSAEGVYVIEPCSLAEAVEKNNLQGTNLSGLQIQLILAPYYTGSHWYLIAVDIANTIISIYDKDPSGDDVATFLGKSVNSQLDRRIDWTIQRMEVNKLQYDGSNCDVFLLFNAQSVLGHDKQQALTEPNQLRLYYLQLLLQSVKDLTRANERLTGSTKRKYCVGQESTIWRTRPCVVFTETDERRLPQGSENDLSELVSDVGSPQVFANLATMVQCRSDGTSGNGAEYAMRVFTEAESQTLDSAMRKRVAGMYIYAFYQARLPFHRDSIRRRRTERRRTRGKQGHESQVGKYGKDAGSYAIEEVVGQWLQKPVEQGRTLDKESYKWYRESVKRARDIGEETYRFIRGFNYHAIWALLPIGKEKRYAFIPPCLLLLLSVQDTTDSRTRS
jgi:hypothetical protein